ncbi:hypothetical protein AQUCO_00700091v1 [Aquilegia coerulea]|uniref:Vacuolar protein sorting-associated protein 13 VPS13 adaptor binding domain-containing protein n=1 Tax=Aquilegia coerulea TaxID=218851 RepID=A0A2G5EIG3_AQUCA|nr:hypothetical protein AQUCO_00700091v1 [Aquilegia coerulea]
MHDVNLELQLSVTDDTVASFLKIKKLSVEALHLQHTCLLKGLIGAILMPQQVCSLALNATLFDIGLKREEHANRIFSIDDLSASIKLKDLRLLDLNICVPQFNIAFSPIDLPILQVSDIFTFKEVNRARNGRELWNLAASRIHSLTSNPKLSLLKFVNAARLWLRYIHSYESLLSLIGYPAEIAFEKSSAKMSLNKKFSISVKNQLKEISEFEEDLSVAALARARQIARHRAAVRDQQIASSIQPNLEANTNFSLKFLSFLTRTICFILLSVMHLSFLEIILNRHSKVNGSSKVVLEDNNPHYCFNIRKVFITVYPVSAGPSLIGGTSESPVRISSMNLLSFCVTLDVFSLIYTAGNMAQSLYLSCGDFKVNSTSLIVPLKDRNAREEKSHPVERKSKERSIDSKVIVRGEPAPKSPHTEQVVVDSVDTIGSASFLHLESYLEELWSNWKRIHNKFEGIAQYIENPFLLCEIKSSLMDQSLDCPLIGLSKCYLSMGKLNVDLGHSSIISMALFLRQIQLVLHRNASRGGATVHSQPIGINEPEERKWQDLQTLYASGAKMAILRVTPEKKIQIGIVITGPKIRMSLLGGLHNAKEQNVNSIVTQGHSDFYIAFNLENIELCVWPTSKASLGVSTQKSDVGLENFRSNAPQLINTTEECLNEKFIYEGSIGLDSCIRMSGLTVYLEDLGENHQYQVLGLNALFIRSSSIRKYTISFPTTVIALSTSLRGMATGAIVLSYMDEYEIFFQVFERVLSALSYALTNLELISGVYHRETEVLCEKDADVFTQLSEKGSFLILKCIQVVIDASFDFGSVDIIIQNSRKNHIVEYYKRTYGVSSKIPLNGRDVPEHGIAVAVQKSHAQLLWEEGHVETCIGLSGLQLVIFSHQSETGEHQNIYELRNVLYQSPNCLYELCMPSCSLTLCTGSHNAINSYTSSCSNYNAIDGPPLVLHSEGSDIQSRDSNQRVRSMASNLLINIDLGGILMSEYSLRNVLNRPHEETKLLSSLCIPMDDHTISWTIQGGLIILEMTALVMYIRCFSAYFLRIQNAASILPSREFISSGRQSEAVEPYKEMVGQSNHPSKEYHIDSTSSLPHSGTCNTYPQSKWIKSEGLRLTLSQFSLILVIANGSGGVSQFVLEADFLFYIEFSTLRRKSSFDLSRLTVVSQYLHGTFQEHTDDVQVLRSSPVADSEFPSSTVSGDVSLGSQCTKSVPPICCDASSSSPVPQKEFIVENDIGGHFHFIHGNYILKHAAASVLVEKAVSRSDVDHFQLNIDWIGSGSVSGLDITISLTEIEMILSLVDSLSDNLSGGDAGNPKQRHRSRSQGHNNVSEDKVPDGAIVAIQDLHQHTYFAVDGLENIYRVIGAIHYSLVGEKALFRVKHCSKKRWGSTTSWFTLTSLHAKSDLEEPLRLNYRSGSGFVDISSNNDDCSLWRALDYTPENYEADNDFESNSQSSKHTFYLVNKKCGRSVAFIDGVPEFVKKPGNIFKFKLFPDVTFTPHVISLDPPSERTYDPDVQHQTHQDEDQTSGVASNLPYINITMDKVVLTIVHELPVSNDKFPLLQACIDNIQLIVQVLPSKARFISTFTATILYFDAQGNLWREIVRPVDMCIFYHCRFEDQSSEIVTKGVPAHFYFRIKQVEVSLTELSLDILLFVAGELKLAGPFAVRSSVIFANCCKIENQSSLNLICCFYDKKETTVSAKRSVSIFIRPVALASRPENSSFLSVQLAALGDFTTSPIHVSLSNARVLAWRTRVISLQDSRSFPGPFVVVDVSKTTEDGLSVVVSPLLRVHNETGFSMEILFWRPKQKEAESASVLLRNGDTIDDSMAALDAINLHGGSKKALMSLILGNFLFSCRPVITEQSGDLGESISAEWSEDLKGGKVVCLSGIFDKLNYRFRQALGVKSGKISFSTVRCALIVEGARITDLHFLIQTIGKDVPVVQPDELRDTTETRTVPVALQEQKEIFLLPTVQVTNYLQSEIHVLLTETQPDLSSIGGCSNIGKQATISCGSSANLYVNPAMIYFTVTLTEFNSSCKAVNSGDWVKKLQKKRSDLNYLDIDLDFGGGKYFASLRLSRSDRGVLEAAIFTSYVLQNDCELSLLCFASSQKPLSRLEIEKFGSSLPPDLGSFLPPKTTRSWFMKSNRMNLKLLDDKASMALLDMDVLSGFTELCLETYAGDKVTHISKLGVSLKPWNAKMSVPSQIVSIVPRYAVLNETDQTIFVQQCCLEEDLDGVIAVDGKQKAALHMKTGSNRRRERKLLDSLFRKHKNASEDYLIYIQFRLNDIGSSWSGPICIASLGRFFLKFRRHVDSLGSQSSPTTGQESKLTEFAVVHVVEEGPALVLHFDRPLNFTPPYRIENLLRNASITYYQKDSMDPDILGPGSSFGYVWDDLSLPHQLVVQITGMNLSREISLDKVRPWKPFFKVRQQRGLALDLPLEKKSRNQIKDKDELFNLEKLKVGYEVYADGATRVLRISEFPGRGKEDSELHLCAKYQLRVSNLAIHILENKKQDENVSVPSVYSPIVVARLGNINFDSMITDQNKYNQIRIQVNIVHLAVNENL